MTVEPTVFLIGLLRKDGSGHPLCVEPEEGPIIPADFDGLHDRAAEVFDQDPESKVLTSESLLTDGGVVYGLGRHRAGYPSESESLFQVLVIGDGVLELYHAGVPLATILFGVQRLPEQRLRRERLDDIAGRVFGQCDTDALWSLATAAADAEHGTMLVMSERAAEEAARVESQALTIEST